MRTRHLPILLSITGLVCLFGTQAFGQVAKDKVSAAGIDGFQLLYAFEEVPETPNFTLGAEWDVDNSDTPVEGVVDRIGFYYQLDDDWVWASLAAFTQDLKKMGFPGNGTPEATAPDFLWQGIFPDLVVEAADDFLVTPGTFNQANLEIWRFNYGQANGNGVPNADDATFDFGDTPAAGGDHGSFQIHNVDAQETIFSINHFNRGLAYETTIGNCDCANPDGTFNAVSAEFFDRVLEIWVKPFGGLDGDFNQDGVVDMADLLIIAGNMNETGTTRETGDLTGDFQTDLHDFILFRESFNAPAGAAATASVPEPSAFGLACLAMLGVLSTRRRQSRYAVSASRLLTNFLNINHGHRKMKTHRIFAGLVLATYWLALGECLGQSPTLLVDRVTGTGTITNDAGTLGLTGYTIRSENLLKLEGWQSLADQSIDGWLEANPKATILAELNASNESTLEAGAAGLGLGSLFTTGLRPVFEDVSFEVSTSDSQFLVGEVRYTGPANSVTLRIDPATGDGQLENFSTVFEDDVTGYSIFSPGGALSTNWTSLADAGVEGWLEANPKTTALAEVNAASSTVFSAGTVHKLGNVWDTNLERDLVLNYLTRDGEVLVGAVDYDAASVPSFLPADFDENGTVEFADFLFLADAFGNAVDPPGTDPDISGNGTVDFADFLILADTFGQSTAAAAAVPEPTALSLLMFGGMLLGLVRRKRFVG